MCREINKSSWKPYEIQISTDDLPDRSIGNIQEKKVFTSKANNFTSPKRPLSRKKRMESTAKKNHSSSSQVNNFSREENNIKSDKKSSHIGNNIHMRETFKCGDDSQIERLGFSFLENQKKTEKESLALWKNVSMPLSSPVKSISKSQNKENLIKSSIRRSGRRNQNPFNDSKESQNERINSSKTRLIKFHHESGMLSKETNMSSLTNQRIRNNNSIQNNLKPIWQDSPLTSFNQIQSFRSENKSSSLFNNRLPDKNNKQLKVHSIHK